MAKGIQDNNSGAIEGTWLGPEPTSPKINLKTIDDVRLEMAKVYREMRTNQMEAQQGTKLVYVLSSIGKLIELHEIEKRIEALEDKLNERK